MLEPALVMCGLSPNSQNRAGRDDGMTNDSGTGQSRFEGREERSTGRGKEEKWQAGYGEGLKKMLREVMDTLAVLSQF